MRGKLTVVALFVIGLLAAAAGWWQGYQRGQRVLRWWGPSTAALVRLAPQVEVARLVPFSASETNQPSGSAAAAPQLPPSESPSTASAPTPLTADLTIGNTRWAVADTRDISQVRGLVHARQALIDDPSYLWENSQQPTAGSEASDRWEFLIVFRSDKESCQFAFSPTSGRLYHAETQRIANIQPIQSGLAKFCEEQFKVAPEGSAPMSSPESPAGPTAKARSGSPLTP